MRVNRQRWKRDGQNLPRAPSIKTQRIGRVVRSRRVLSSGAILPRSNSIVDPREDRDINTGPRVRRDFSSFLLRCKRRSFATTLTSSSYGDKDTLRTRRSRDECTRTLVLRRRVPHTRVGFLFSSLSTTVHPMLSRRN